MNLISKMLKMVGLNRESKPLAPAAVEGAGARGAIPARAIKQVIQERSVLKGELLTQDITIIRATLENNLLIIFDAIVPEKNYIYFVIVDGSNTASVSLIANDYNHGIVTKINGLPLRTGDIVDNQLLIMTHNGINFLVQ